MGFGLEQPHLSRSGPKARFTRVDSRKCTFADRAQFWFDNMHDIVRGRTWDSMTSAINKHLLPALKDVPVDAIDEDVAQSFVTTLTKKS